AYQGTKFSREYFASYPDQVGMMRFSADKPGSINLTFSLTSKQPNSTISVINGDTLLFAGAVEQRHGKSKKLITGEKSLQFEARLQFTVTGGKIRKTRDENNKPAIRITGADEVVVTCAAATDYKLSFPTYTGEAPSLKNKATLTALAGKPYSELKAAHIADYSNLFSRVDFSLEGTDRSNLPTDARRAEYKKDKLDRDFEALIFQYGRYLLIAGSRPGNLPTNLKGIWNETMQPAWLADFHLNMNFQMNYWLADVSNLSECFEPLADWAIEALQKPGKKTAQVHYNSKGWVAHHVANIWGSTVPGPKRAIWMYEAESGAFLMQNVWDHFAYTQDLDYLQNKAWPLMKGCAEFWMDNLQELPNGDLCVSPAYSPEQGPLTDDAFWHTMIIWDLFDNCIKATEILDTDHAFAETLKTTQARIQKPIIGELGQLQEWRDPAIEIEMDVQNNKHRHFSHLYSVYPGHQIIPGRDPELTEAAVKSLTAREHPWTTGWSFALKISTWARLRNGDLAYKQLGDLVSKRFFDNLWSKEPPFLIDANYGYVAGVAEMLMQSHNPGSGRGNGGKIEFLPALPSVWPAGSISGLKARGNVLVDLVWEDGKATKITVQAAKEGTYTFVYGTKEVEVKLVADVPTSLGSYFNLTSGQ
ncbi:MAG: glycoside hydrolase family 95 protein, partial [Kiritimatiellaceae bacterium]|nr:glycoside hydrolase family 95 protein [Kiritimatiellaceae bacterium]